MVLLVVASVACFATEINIMDMMDVEIATDVEESWEVKSVYGSVYAAPTRRQG